MAGYSRKTASKGKLDDLFVRGVLIESENNQEDSERILLISLDLLSIPLSITTYIQNRLLAIPKFGLKKKENILIHAIHTHSGPDLTGWFHWTGNGLNILRGMMFGHNRNDKYIVFLCQQILAMVDKMVTNLQLTNMAVVSKRIEEDIVINRRNPGKKSKRNLTVFVFRKQEDNSIFGIMANYGMHPTTLSFENDKISADYPGRVCHFIESISDHQISAIFFTGSAGDLNPITTCGNDFDALQEDPKGEEKIYDQLGDYSHTKQIGEFLGKEAYALANSIPDDQYYNKISMKNVWQDITIPLEDFQPYIYDFKIWIKNKILFYVKTKFLFRIYLLNSAGNTVNFPTLTFKSKFQDVGRIFKAYRIQVVSAIQYMELRLGSSTNTQKEKKEHKIALLGVPGEVFEELEKKLQHQSPVGAERTFIFQNSNSWIGYLFPIKDYITEGGYEPEAAATPVAGRNVSREFLKMFKRIGFKN